MKKIRISAGKISVLAELNDSVTAREIFKALPLRSAVNTWGDEIYFDIPVELPQGPGARADVDVGELGYWPVGHAFCVFFGPTPASTGAKPKAASAVNLFGKVIGDTAVLRKVRDGETVQVVVEE